MLKNVAIALLILTNLFTVREWSRTRHDLGYYQSSFTDLKYFAQALEISLSNCGVPPLRLSPEAEQRSKEWTERIKHESPAQRKADDAIYLKRAEGK